MCIRDRDAGAATGLNPEAALGDALLDFVRMKTAVAGAPPEAAELGGYPDSAHFFSFAELALRRLSEVPEDPFWLALGRGAVAAQPVYLAIQFLAGRRAPRSVLDYGPWDLLGHPDETVRRLAAAPLPEDLRSAGPAELARLAARNAYRGFIA